MPAPLSGGPPIVGDPASTGGGPSFAGGPASGAEVGTDPASVGGGPSCAGGPASAGNGASSAGGHWTVAGPVPGHVKVPPRAADTASVRGSVDTHWYALPLGTSALPQLHTTGEDGVVLPQATAEADTTTNPQTAFFVSM